MGGGVGGTTERKEVEASETASTKPAAALMERSRYVLSTAGGGGREVANTYQRDKPGNDCDRRGTDWGKGGIGESEGSVVGGRKSTGGGGTKRGNVCWVVSAGAITPHREHPSPPNTRGFPPDCHPLSTGICLSTAMPSPGGELRPLPVVHGKAAAPVPYPAMAKLDSLLMTLLAQQLPPLPNFSGEHMDSHGETFEEWLEWLDLVAATCRWDDQTNLVNIDTRLKGSASRFYRTCTPQQRSNYTSLTTAMKQLFTPVRVQAVQSSRFHETKQGPKETVDSYARDLCRLFQQAYSSSTSTNGAVQMGQSVLAYQFVVGLVSELKSKLVGHEGSFEQLLEVARF